MDSNQHMGRPDENISDSDYRAYAMRGNMTMITFIIIFFVVALLTYLYDHWYMPRSRSHHIRRNVRNHRPTMVFFATNPSPASLIAPRGLDPAIVKSLPVFTFSDAPATHNDPIDCAVCLSEFEEGESGRVLPGCKHAFHVECIDMWFHSHSTCPLCRTLVEPPATTVEEQVAITISSEPVSATEPGSSSGSGSSAMPLEDLERNLPAIEVPRRNFSELEDDLTRNSLRSRSFTLPMSRMLSLTRMLSRDRRTYSSSFVGAPPQSPSSSCRIPMTESDTKRGGEEIK